MKRRLIDVIVNKEWTSRESNVSSNLVCLENHPVTHSQYGFVAIGGHPVVHIHCADYVIMIFDP